ncbi:MAG: hypothetical protein NWF07_11975 [Candidatus Bathyarchaeota archaeon]|nr:hypothetical protein [Candidatus Bathyarchaeota archaeon]
MSRRKMLAADEDVANKVSKLAQRRGYTVNQTVNEIDIGLMRLCFKK